MRMEYLEYLLEVAHSNSISAAAKKLFIGQTTLSAIINSIEAELNVQIFQRTHRGVKLTEQGERVIAMTEDIVEKNHQLMQLYSQEYAAVKNVHVVAYPAACSALGLHLTKLLTKELPEVTLNMTETPSSKVVSSIVGGAASIGVGASARYEFFNSQYIAHNNGLAFEVLHTDHFCLCVGKNSPFADRKSVDVSELRDEYLAVTASHPGSSTSSVGGVFKHIRRFTVFSNAEVIKRAVLLNNMIAILPGISYYEDPSVAFGDLRLIPITGFETELAIYLIVNEKIGLNPYEETVVRMIRKFFDRLARSPLPQWVKG